MTSLDFFGKEHRRASVAAWANTSARRPVFWLFNADNCKVTDLLRASVYLKRFGQGARARVKARIDALSERASESAKQEWIQILDRLDSLLAVDDS